PRPRSGRTPSWSSTSDSPVPKAVGSRRSRQARHRRTGVRALCDPCAVHTKNRSTQPPDNPPDCEVVRKRAFRMQVDVYEARWDEERTLLNSHDWRGANRVEPLANHLGHEVGARTPAGLRVAGGGKTNKRTSAAGRNQT